ncbi:MAG: hypothetical protein JXR79_09070 [Nitrospirae bacterium]|nr:hypothetical protein [Nitrospirota bacterium]
MNNLISITFTLFWVVLIFSISPSDCFSAWQVEYSSNIIRHTGGPKLRGNFATKAQCEQVRDQSARASGDYSNLMRNSWCVGSNSKSGGYGGTTGYYGKHAIAMQFMEAMLGGLFQGLFDSPQNSANSKEAAAYQQMLKQQQEAEAARKKEEERRKYLAGLDRWKSMKQEAENDQADKERQAALLAQRMGSISGGGGLSREDIGSSSGLQPFKWDNAADKKLALDQLGDARYDTSSMPEWQRLACAAQFSGSALVAMKKGNAENARYLNEQASRMSAGQPVGVSCQLDGMPQVPDVPDPVPVAAEEMKKLEKLMEQINSDIKEIQQIEVKMQEVSEQKVKAQEKVQQAEVKVNEIKAQQPPADMPDKKAEHDALLEEALRLQQEAEKELAQSVKSEEELRATAQQKYESLKQQQQDMTSSKDK